MGTFLIFWSTVLIALTSGQKSSLPPIRYTSLGCWKDNKARAIPTREGQSSLLIGKYNRRDHAIERCALVAFHFGDSVFAVQNGGWCASSSTAQQTYKKYGAATACKANGAGGPWANNVYQIVSPGLNANAPGVTWHGLNNVEFSISSGNGTFFAAKDICYSYNGTLALLKTNETRMFLQTIMSPGTDRYWIGLSKDSTVNGGAYLWQDGTSFTTSQGNYARGEPKTQASYKKVGTVVQSNGLWYASKASLKKRYICQRIQSNQSAVTTLAQTTPTVTSSMSSSSAVTTTPVQTTPTATSSMTSSSAVTTTPVQTTPTATSSMTSSSAVTTTPVQTTFAVTSLTKKAIKSVVTTLDVGYCKATSIFVPGQNESYSFPRTKAELSSMSKQKCSGGYPMASINCISNISQPGHAYFGTPVVINCGASLRSVAAQVNLPNATTASVSDTTARLKILTSNISSFSVAQVKEVATALQVLSQTDPKKVAINVTTMYDVLVTVDQISPSFSASSFAWPSLQSSVIWSRAIVKALQRFIDRVILSLNSTEITLYTSHTNIKISEPTVKQNKHGSFFNSVIFGSPSSMNGTQQQVVSAEVPGTLLDQAQQFGKNIFNATSSVTPVRIAFILNKKARLFPSSETPTDVISMHIRGYQPTSTTVGIKIKFGNVKVKQGSVSMKNDTLKDVVTRTQCSVYRDFDGHWVSTGCSLEPGSSPPKCTCYKLASFSMIVSSKVLPSAFALGIVSYVGCSLSIIGLIITIWVYLAIKELRQRQPTTYLLNICFNLLVVIIIFIVGIGRVSISATCFLSTILLHYFLLVTWFWMSANAYNMYKALAEMARIGQSSSSIPTTICYLLPALIVLINSTVAIFYEDAKHYHPHDPFFQSVYRARNMCWLRHHSLNFGFLLPVGLLSLFNLACFISVMRKIACKKPTIQSTAQKRSRREDFVIAITVCFIMGLTWIFGFLMMFADNVIYQSIMAWLFTIFNSAQGLFIFFMNCVRQPKVRRMWWTPLIALCACRPAKQRRNDEGTIRGSTIANTPITTQT